MEDRTPSYVYLLLLLAMGIGVILIGVSQIFYSFDKQIFELCVINDWNESVIFINNSCQKINCIDFWNENFKGKWQDKCSTFFWSDKVSCHDLCNVDCEFYNKENKLNQCVC